jgi:valyl-tRNA synthetase
MFMNVDRIDAGLRPDEVREVAGLRPATDGAEPRHHTDSLPSGVAGFQAGTLEDRWILSRFNRAARDVNESLQTYRFDEAANRIYDFFWGEFCDWYLELIKPRLNFEEGADAGPARAACRNLVNLFEASLRLLHPVMPFITEEIWHAIYDGMPPLKSIALAAYPAADEAQIDLGAETDMAILQDLIASVRNLRAELKVEPKVRVPIEVYAEDPGIRAMLLGNLAAIERLASVEKVTFVEGSLANLPGARSTSRFDVHVVYEKKIDIVAERERLTKELGKLEKQLSGAQARFGDEQFLSKAPAHVVEGLRKQVEEATILREKVVGQLRELG